MFYSFVLNMWMMGRLTEDQVNAYVPKFITAEEAKMILITTTQIQQ